MKRTLRSLLSLMLALWCLSGAPARAEEAEALRLALNWVPEPEFGGFYAAQIEGLYAARGLKVDILPGGAGSPTVQMLEAGKVEFAITSGSEIAVARSRGARVVAVYSVFETSPMGVMARASRGLGSLAELFAAEGTIALEQGQPYVDYLRKRFPDSPARIVPYAGGVTQFLRDETFAQQGFAFAEPVTAEENGVPASFFLLADEGYNPYTVVLAVREDYLERNGPTVQALVAAVREGWQRYRAAPQKANEHMMGLNEAMSPSAFEKGALNQNALLGEGTMTESRWREHIQQLLDSGSIERPVDAAACFRNL